MPSNAPIPGQFEQDTRVSFDQVSGKWQYEDDEGTEHEWNGTAWIPIVRVTSSSILNEAELYV